MPETGGRKFQRTEAGRRDVANLPGQAAASVSETGPPVLLRTPDDSVPHPEAFAAAPPALETTFLTKAVDRAPSAYYIDPQGKAQRARQEHVRGPGVSPMRERVQAFAETWRQARIVTTFVRAAASVSDPTATTFPADQALRMQILDGLASPRVSADHAHVEAHAGALSVGNPHISGGAVTFPVRGSPLADFTHVVDVIRSIRAHPPTSAIAAPAYVSGTTTGVPGRAAKKFNRRAMARQKIFAKAMLASRR